jgi:hypothetical protein
VTRSSKRGASEVTLITPADRGVGSLARECGRVGGQVPDVVTMNVLLAGLVSSEPPRLAQAEDLFAEMVEAGPQPDKFTFSILLKVRGGGQMGDQREASVWFAAR